jgi:hypothetical protein
MNKSSVPKLFMPSTNASMVSTPDTGAETTTEKGSKKSFAAEKSTGV